MSFLETPRFPGCPSFGFTSTPDYSVTISATVSGYESRNRNWQRPLHVYNAEVGPRREEEIQELLEWWHAMGGQECGFRFKDHADFKSCRVHQTPTRVDQGVDPNEDSPGGYQLVKTYTIGARSSVRKILKPVQGTILLADNGTLKTEGLHYTIDYTTGLVDLNFTPVGVITWGGEFDVPVRFDSGFPVSIVNQHIEHVSFTLKELRDPRNED